MTVRAITEIKPPLTAGTWAVDAAHTTVEFSVRHMTIARVIGRFGAVDGVVEVPADDPRAATVKASIDVTSVSSGHPKRDELIRSEDFLDAAQFPVMTFESSPPEATSDEEWRIPGILTIKGVSHAVDLNTVFVGVINHRGATRAGFSATTQISRKDFGVTWNAGLDSGGAIVSDTIRITLEVELVLSEG